MICPHCGKQHPDRFTYCPETSNFINADQSFTYNTIEYCANCSAKNEKGYSYCVQCGHSFLAKAPKKKGFSRLVEDTFKDTFKDTFSNIKIPTKVNVNTEEIKTASVENLNYIKNNKLILVPIAISIILVFLISLIIKSSVVDTMKDALGDSDFTGSIISSTFEDKVSVPFLVELVHNVNYKFKFSVIGQTAKVDFNNIFSGLLIIPILSLLIGGIIYGRMAVKNKWPLYKGIIYSAISYTLILLIISFFAHPSYEVNFLGKIELKLSPSILDILLTSVILTLLYFGSAAIISYYGKEVFTRVSETSKALLYALCAFLSTACGVIISYLYSFIFLVKDLADGSSFLTRGFISVYGSVATWLTSLFGKLQIAHDSDKISYQFLFSSDDKDSVISELNLGDELFKYVFLFTIIAIVIIGAAGYFIYEKHQLNIKDVAIFGGFFALMQFIIMFMFNIKLEDSTGEIGNMKIGFTFFSTIIGSFIISAASFYGGGFIRNVLKK